MTSLSKILFFEDDEVEVVDGAAFFRLTLSSRTISSIFSFDLRLLFRSSTTSMGLISSIVAISSDKVLAACFRLLLAPEFDPRMLLPLVNSLLGLLLVFARDIVVVVPPPPDPMSSMSQFSLVEYSFSLTRMPLAEDVLGRMNPDFDVTALLPTELIAVL